MILETPGKRQSAILENIFFSLPHKPINFHNADTFKKSPVPFIMPLTNNDEASDNAFSDDGSSTYSDGDDNTSIAEDSDALDENLSDTDDDDSSEGDYEEAEVLNSASLSSSPPQKEPAGTKSNGKPKPNVCSNSSSNSKPKSKSKTPNPSPKAKPKAKNRPPSLSAAMRKKDLFGGSEEKSKSGTSSSFPAFPGDTAQTAKKKQDSKTYRLSGGSKKKGIQEIIPIGSKAVVEKKQSKLNFRNDAPSSSSPRPRPRPRPKSKSKSKSTSNAMQVDEPEGSFESSLQTMKSTKMENGTYRGKVAYIVRRGNLSSKYIMQVPRRGKRHPVLGECEKQPTLTEQIKALTESKLLRFRDLTYVYIHASGKKDQDGVFVAGLFTSSGTMTHVNATTVELPAYKELYAEEGGTSHRQAKIKDVITSENKQKGTSFVLKIGDGGEEKMVELQLPFLSTQAYHSIVNEDRRVTKQRLGRDKEKEKERETTKDATASAVSALAKATSDVVNQVSQGTSCPGAPLKRKREESKETPEPDSPVVWPLSDKKRRILGQIMAKMHESKIEKFAVAVDIDTSGLEKKLYTVDMNIGSVNLI